MCRQGNRLLKLLPLGVPEIAFELAYLVEVHDPGPEVMSPGVFLVDEGIGVGGELEGGQGLAKKGLVRYGSLQYIGGHAAVDEGLVGFRGGYFLSQNVLIHDQGDEVDAGQAREIGAASGTYIDLKKDAFPGARVVF